MIEASRVRHSMEHLRPGAIVKILIARHQRLSVRASGLDTSEKDVGDCPHKSSFIVGKIPLFRERLRARPNPGYIRILFARSGRCGGPALFGLQPSGLFLLLPLLPSFLFLTLLESR